MIAGVWPRSMPKNSTAASKDSQPIPGASELLWGRSPVLLSAGAPGSGTHSPEGNWLSFSAGGNKLSSVSSPEGPLGALEAGLDPPQLPAGAVEPPPPMPKWLTP